MDYISERVAKKVLSLGAPYKNYKGGIGAVIAVYHKHFKPFKFIASYSYGNILHILGRYVVSIFQLLGTLITDREIKIVHIHSASRGSFLRKSFIFFISKTFGKKVVFHVHGAEFHLFYERSPFKRYIKYIINNADLVICLSKEWETYFSTNFKCRKLEILFNVIEEPPVHELDPNRDSRLHLLFLGRVGYRKGIFDLLDVLIEHKNLFQSHFKLSIGGDGEIERLQNIIKDNKLEDWVSYVGWVSADKKHQLLSACDVYVLPSYNEGLPISVLEAMSYGKPVISTNVGGIPQIVKPGVNGWVHEAGNKEQITHILNGLIGNEEQIRIYGNNSLDLVKPYLPAHVFSYLNTLYIDLINESTASKRPA